VTVHTVPPLNIGLTNGMTALRWLATANTYTLESTVSLAPCAWSTVTNAPVLTGGFCLVTNAWSERTRFFRLHGN